MPDSKISALPSATVPLAGTEVLPIVQSSTTDKVTAADLLRQNGQTVTTSNPVLSLAQTWNAGGVTFTADLINVTDTASAATSRLFARQVGGVDKFVVLKTGATQIGGAAPAGSSGLATIQSFGNTWAMIGADVLTDATNKIMRLGVAHYTNSQIPVLALTITAASGSNTLNIGGGSAAGLGATDLLLYTATNNTSAGTVRWQLNSVGHFLASTDNTYDIGASGANRPRTIYAATSFISGNALVAGSGGSISFLARTSMASPSDGILLLQNNASTDFTRLQFGGTTNSFPALKRSANSLDVRFADDSGDATLNAGALRSAGSVFAGYGTAIPAGGSNGIGFKGTSATNFGVFFGSGAPTLSAAKGSLYLRSDGSGTGDRMYVNTDSSTTWTAVTTAA